MVLRLPSEIIVDRVLPTLRVRLACELADRDFTQQEIADRLGVTQAAVSNYVSGEVVVEERIDGHPQTQETLERIAEGFNSGRMDGYDALAEVLELIRAFEDRGPICELHEAAMPALEGLGCDLCVRGSDKRLVAEREVLTDVRVAARILARAPGMADFVPNVGTNIGFALSDAADPTDVAAIPGRIYAIGGRVEVPANPEFGASRNVATVVLAAMATDPEMRAAVNVAMDEALLVAARDRGIEALEFEADYENRNEHLRQRFRERGRVPRVAFHRGAFGIEPIIYILGETAQSATTMAADLVGVAREEA